MACDLKQNIERMHDVLDVIRKTANDSLCDEVYFNKDGDKYRCLSKAIGQIAVKVRDTMSVKNYWYAKFVEDGVLVKPKGER